MSNLENENIDLAKKLEPFIDEAGIGMGVLGVLAGIATYVVHADPSKQGEVFGSDWMKRFGEKNKGKDEKDPTKPEDKDSVEGLQKAAENNDSKSFVRHYLRLSKPLRAGLHGVARGIKAGTHTVEQYRQALKRVAKGASFSLKRSVYRTIHTEMAKFKLTYTGETLKFKTARGKTLEFKKGKTFALTKRKVHLGGGWLLQTYNPLQLNTISSSIAGKLESNSKPRSEKANKRDGNRIQPKKR